MRLLDILRLLIHTNTDHYTCNCRFIKEPTVQYQLLTVPKVMYNHISIVIHKIVAFCVLLTQTIFYLHFHALSFRAGINQEESYNHNVSVFHQNTKQNYDCI